jgi:hypothetical protein
MKVINHVNLESLKKTEEKFKKDPYLAKKVNRIEGEWILDSKTGPQFRAEIPIEKGTAVLEAEQPTSLRIEESECHSRSKNGPLEKLWPLKKSCGFFGGLQSGR